MVYVLNVNGQPLMPTNRYGKVRHLLKGDKAKVIRRCPFTIKLLYEPSTNVIQDITLGVDSGSKHIGFSASTQAQELYASQVETRNDIKELLATRRECRSARRSRKTRYRAPRFNNRIKSKHEGWLAPSIENKIQTHLKEIEFISSILPIKDIIVEIADFDLQRLKAEWLELAKPEGEKYQKGEMLGFWNARQYVLFRDNYVCKACKGKSGDKVLNVHHIISRKIAGNAPDNLVTLCEICHSRYHKGEVDLPNNINKGLKFVDPTHMGIMKWFLYNSIKDKYENVSLTYGYITKSKRINNVIEKSHVSDAFCIANNLEDNKLNFYYLKKKVRCHNRQIHKFKINKGGMRKLNQAPFKVKGFELFDKVEYNNQICFITGRRSSGYFVIKDIKYNKVSDSVKFDKLKFLEHSNNYIVDKIIKKKGAHSCNPITLV